LQLRQVIVAAAWLEVLVGGLILFVPELFSLLLFGGRPDATGVLLTRFAGIGLLALGIACLPLQGESGRGSVRGLVVFNIGVALFLACAAIATAHRGILIWPATVLHAAIAAALLLRMRGNT
jgi:hypothetical protein